MQITWQEIRDIIRSVLEEEMPQILEKDDAGSDRKPHCSKGNPYFDENGRWTDRKGAKSFSLKFSTPKNSKHCVGGQARMPGQRFAKLPAGRKTPEGGKEKYKLKDGSDAFE